MRDFKYIWVIGLVVTALIVVVPIVLFTTGQSEASDDPYAHLPPEIPHTDHTVLMTEPFESATEVTARCLECHEDAAHEVQDSVHWTWQADAVEVAWHDEPLSVGKANLINNFCIGIQSNYESCTSCHAGYGWTDADFDFSADNAENIDCLVCHDTTGTYVKGRGGYPVEGVDLLSVAQNVGVSSRETCGSCHFNGGGGNGVKHGDLDQSLINPPESLDVHMGRLDFECSTCHRTEDHQIGGRSISVSVDDANQVYCTDCHSDDLHADERINDHLDAVACQTCHVPAGARREGTKLFWDWSTAGNDWPEDPHAYLKIKGSFIYEENFIPAYDWYSGTAERYLLGDPINPDEITVINDPLGNIDDPDAKIWPFKIHEARQPYDTVYNYLLQPTTSGEGGFWSSFDWHQAFVLGSEATGLPYSGEYGFATTHMYWPQTHMVAPASDALQCTDCHGDEGRLDWTALGYFGDPIHWGGRE
jgi:octaheme c-type cytochrome (tetrathionate reductase family)